ncbi:MAG TPA: guanylate kinase [Acidobacteriota bacterium]|nr:guanylate kinase [Acidobacteriota bacterium]
MRGQSSPLAKRRGIIFILSAPSGAGKTTLYNGLRKIYPEIKLSVSCTTRARRRGEISGRDYRFISVRQFNSLKQRGEFAEWAKVHDYFYGTPKRPLDRVIKAGGDILLDVDVQGARSIKKAYPKAVAVFVLPPSVGELKRRLAARGTDDKEIIRRRLANARGEIGQIIQYDYYVVNRKISDAVRVLGAIVEAERARVSRVSEWRMEPLRPKHRRKGHEGRQN